jgi:outer membrane biosynthesis protein TonB
MMLPPSLRLPVQMAGLLHFLVVVFIIYGLPALIEPQPETVPVITVEVLNMSEVANAPPAPKAPTPKPTEEKMAEETPPPPKVEPKPETPPPPPPTPVKQPDPPPPQPKPEPVPTPPPPPPKPEPTPVPPPKVEPKPEPPKPEPPKPEPPKPVPPKPEPVKKPEPEKDFFKEMQAAVDAAKPKTPPVPVPKPAQKAAQSPTQTQTADAKPAPPASNAPNYDPARQPSTTEIAAMQGIVQKAMEPCWSPPVGALDLKNLKVNLRITFSSNGVVQDVALLDRARYMSDTYYRSAADAAIRALRNPACSKIPLPVDHYDYWQTTTLNFDPSEFAR